MKVTFPSATWERGLNLRKVFDCSHSQVVLGNEGFIKV